MATVDSAVPDASSTARSTARLGTPPVPTISRDVRVWPASRQEPAVSPGRPGSGAAGPRNVPLGICVAVMSSSLHRGDDLDLVAIAQDRAGPAPARQHLAVDRGGDAG